MLHFARKKSHVRLVPIIVSLASAAHCASERSEGGQYIRVCSLKHICIGIPTLTIVNPSFNTPASGVGFSIPANRAAFIVPQLIQSGKVTDQGLADLGLAGTTIDATAAAQLKLPVTQGVLVTSVAASGPAAQAGLKAGEVIVRLNDRAVTDEAALVDNVLNKSPGVQVALQVYRGTQLTTVNVTLGKLSIP